MKMKTGVWPPIMLRDQTSVDQCPFKRTTLTPNSSLALQPLPDVGRQCVHCREIQPTGRSELTGNPHHDNIPLHKIYSLSSVSEGV